MPVQTLAGWMPLLASPRKESEGRVLKQRLTNQEASNVSATRAAVAFLKNRLNRIETLEWALLLPADETLKRDALREILASQEGNKLKEPLLGIWRLLEESWETQAITATTSVAIYRIKDRLEAGDRSGLLIDMINQLVAPRLIIEPAGPNIAKRAKLKGPLRIEDFLHPRLTSQRVVDLDLLSIKTINDVDFLSELASVLETSVRRGMGIARRIGWDGQYNFRRLGQISRVEYTSSSVGNSVSDIDSRRSGIAPSVKLLLAVIKRLAQLDLNISRQIAGQWKHMPDPIHVRLWSALSKDVQITEPSEVGNFLLSLADEPFWNLNGFPEIAELRSQRFTQLSIQYQSDLLRRIRKGPPRPLRARKAPAEQIKAYRLRASVQELRRLEISGFALPEKIKKWLNEHVQEFPDLISMDSIDYGFPKVTQAYWYKALPDPQFDILSGELRLKVLESKLSTDRGRWQDDPAERAQQWIKEGNNSTKLLDDFESSPDFVNRCPRVLDAFGWSHTCPLSQNHQQIDRETARHGDRVISLLLKLEHQTAYDAIEGLSHWISEWARVVVESPALLQLWAFFWPVAVKATNDAIQDNESDILNQTVVSSDDSPADLDTLNTPAGRLVGIFLQRCPGLDGPEKNPFTRKKGMRRMFISLLEAPGRAGLIAKHRLIESLEYFLKVDRARTERYLIKPLDSDNAESLALWRSIASTIRSKATLEIIGPKLLRRVTDLRLSRESRKMLLASIVVEAIYSYLERRDPAVPYFSLQQAIRSVEDEVRADAAGVPERFASELSDPNLSKTPRRPEEIFQAGILPFLKNVWPQEHALSAPSSSAAFARLPASVGNAFAGAVDSVERFLVPFNCWSLHDFGFWAGGDQEAFTIVKDSPRNAAALLKLLDATIGHTEGAVIPMDLAQALDHIHEIAPELASSPAFRRLGTLARRR